MDIFSLFVGIIEQHGLGIGLIAVIVWGGINALQSNSRAALVLAESKKVAQDHAREASNDLKDTLEEQIGTLRNIITQQSDRLKELETQNTVKADRITSLEALLKETIETKDAEIADLYTKLAEITQKYETTLRNLESELLARLEFQDRANKLLAQNESLMATMANIRANNMHYINANSELHAKLNDERVQNRMQLAEIDKLKARIQELEIQLKIRQNRPKIIMDTGPTDENHD